ncbi:MAG: OmpH family outer membrane protein [Thiothrix sp.]|uniref:OmpH family outer membrane protein n=1 Tax=Thiothrix sp. TaxID=1032 RepID=UPI00260A609C|nr:OmpH family outer membrane protein [Thiothrix sp.]MDD5392513.1 OmpH family outer membrane protein [Thiothrix sp.]
MALADDAARPFRLAIVNVSTLLESSPQSKAANDKLKAAFVTREEGLNKEQQAIQQAEEELAVRLEAGSISEEEKLQQQRELRDRKRKNTRALEDFREEVRTARDTAVDNLQTQIVQAIGEVREQEQIDVVLRESDYIVASDRGDITAKVMQHLEQKFQAEKAAVSPDSKAKE